MEDDPSMQERWVNLLANAGIVGDAMSGRRSQEF